MFEKAQLWVAKVLIVGILTLFFCSSPVAGAEEADNGRVRVESFVTQFAQDLKAQDIDSLSKKLSKQAMERLSQTESFEQEILRASQALRRKSSEPVKVTIDYVKKIKGQFYVEAMLDDLSLETLILEEVGDRLILVDVFRSSWNYRVQNRSSGTVSMGCSGDTRTSIPAHQAARMYCQNSRACGSFWRGTTFINFTGERTASCYWKRFRKTDASVEANGSIKCVEAC